jgi:hypothetical protein
MLVVETTAWIRREHFVKGTTIKKIARDLGVRGTRSAGCCDQGDLVRTRAGGPVTADAGAMDS